MVKFSHMIISGMMVGTLLGAPTWAMLDDKEHCSVTKVMQADDLVREVCSNLPPQDLARVSSVSKKWQRISEEDRLWKRYGQGIKSKKNALEVFCLFPYATLNQQELAGLFAGKALSGSEFFAWKLQGMIEIPEREESQTPNDIIQEFIAAVPEAKYSGWTANNITVKQSQFSIVHITTDVICSAELPPYDIKSLKTSYNITLKGFWGGETALK